MTVNPMKAASSSRPTISFSLAWTPRTETACEIGSDVGRKDEECPKHGRGRFSLLDLAFDRYAVIGLPHWLHILQSELMTILAKAVTASRCGHDKAGSIAV